MTIRRTFCPYELAAALPERATAAVAARHDRADTATGRERRHRLGWTRLGRCGSEARADRSGNGGRDTAEPGDVRGNAGKAEARGDQSTRRRPTAPSLSEPTSLWSCRPR